MKRKALCVGVNYKNTPYHLNGGVNDALCISDVLCEQFGFNQDYVHILADEDDKYMNPTLENILNGFDWLLDKSESGDELFFFFSGHSSFKKDLNGDEDDGRDECLFTSDLQLLVDDVIHERLMSLIPEGVNLTCIIDCNHSGSMGDLEYEFIAGRNQVVRKAQQGKEIKGNVIMLSACLDTEQAVDSHFTGKWVQIANDRSTFEWGNGNGAFTWYIMKALKICGYRTTVKELITNTHNLLTRHLFNQTPQLSMSKPELLDSVFLKST